MQDSESMVKAMKAIEAQVKAIAEEFQVAESVALQILEDACGGASAVVRWALSASEEQGTGCKCGEGACKAKEEAQAPVPVSKPVRHIPAQTYNPQQEGAVKMQDSEKSMMKAMKAIEAQMKAIVEEFQVSESVALSMLEMRAWRAAWLARKARAAHGTGCKYHDSGECGHKCGEGACKAKEEAKAPVPVRIPGAPEVLPEASDIIWKIMSAIYR